MRTVRSSRADIFVSIILVLLLCTFTIAQIHKADEVANRVACANNLRLIGHALLFYSNDSRGAYPRTYAERNDNPTPTWGTPYEGDPKLGPRDRKKADPFHAKDSDVVPKPNDVTAALFLLLRTQEINSDAFFCPSSGNEPFQYGGEENSALNWTNWPGNKGLAEHLSYSYQNPYPGRDAIRNGFRLNNAIGELFAVAADINPGVDALTKVTLDAGAQAVRVGNSPNHGGDGQNVLYGDGHIEWQVSPYVGTARDNIYTYGNSGPPYKNAAGDGIVGSPVGANDSILLPTAKDIGVVDDNGKLSEAARKRRDGITADMKPATPQQQEATRQKIMGTYVQQRGGREVKLEVTKDQVIGSMGPSTVTFNYAIADVGDGGVARLVLTAPETPERSVTVKVEPDVLTIRSGQLHGKWVKQ